MKWRANSSSDPGDSAREVVRRRRRCIIILAADVLLLDGRERGAGLSEDTTAV
jgi:hypothetical protein